MFDLKKLNSKILKLLGCYIIFFLILHFLDNRVNVYPSTVYFITYENGFVSRGLIGTVLRFFITDAHIKIFSKIICCTMLTLYIIYIFNSIIKVLKKSKNDNFVFCLLFCFCSSFLLVYSKWEYYMTLDIFWLFISIFIFLCFNNLKKWKIPIIFLLSITGIFIHQGFLFTMCPIICILFLDNKKYKTFFIYGISMICIFLFCQFGGNVDAETVFNSAIFHASVADVELFPEAVEKMQKMIYLEYKYNVWDHFSLIGNEYPFYIKTAIIYIVTNLINLFFLFKLLNKIKFNMNKKLYIAILIISQIPLLVLTIDLDRWTVLMILNLYMFLLYKARKGEINENLQFSKKYIPLFFINLLMVIFSQYLVL